MRAPYRLIKPYRTRGPPVSSFINGPSSSVGVLFKVIFYFFSKLQESCWAPQMKRGAAQKLPNRLYHDMTAPIKKRKTRHVHQLLRHIPLHGPRSAASNESLFSCMIFTRPIFFFFWGGGALSHALHSLIPKKSGVRSGFRVKWMDFIVVGQNKTIRAYSKASWRCQKDTGVLGGERNLPSNLHIWGCNSRRQKVPTSPLPPSL